MKRIFFALMLCTLYSTALKAQILMGDMNDDDNITTSDITAVVNTALGKTAKRYVNAYDANNTSIVGTWTSASSGSIIFNEDGTTTLGEDYTYKFRPMQGRIMVYNASGVLTNVLNAMEVESNYLVLSQDGESTYTYYYKGGQVSDITLSQISITGEKGQTYQLTATVLPSDAAIPALTWTSSNTCVATVSESGLVTVVSGGTATITASAQDGSGITATCNVTVPVPISSITLDETSITGVYGQTYQLTATISPSDAYIQALKWTSSNTDVAIVNESGLVTIEGAGTATITASAQDGSGITASCIVNDYASIPVSSITLDMTSISVEKGQTYQLTATVSPSDASIQALKWSSSNTDVATVNESGLVSVVGGGTATITASAQDGSGITATCNVTVPVPISSITLDETSITGVYGQTYQLTATISPSDAYIQDLTWTSSNTSVATVNESGLVTAVGGGTATITASAKDGSGIRAICTITIPVPVSSITLDKTSIAGEIDQTYQLTATVSPSDALISTLIWSTSADNVATVNESGLVSIVGGGTATITASAKDGSGITATCIVNVSVPIPVSSITLDETNITGENGQTYQLTATVSPSDASIQALKWTSSNTDVATVNESGLVTVVGGGTATITVSARDGSGITATCIVTVSVPIPVSNITLDETSITGENGQTYQLTATVSPSDASIQALKWSSSNTDVATVNESGLVSVVGGGTATITASAKDGSGITANCTVTVPVDIDNVVIKDTTVTMTNNSVTAGSTIETIDFSTLGYSNAEKATSVKGSNCTITFDKGTGSTAPTFYTNTKGIRVYASNSITITGDYKAIAKVVMTCDSSGSTNYVGQTTATQSYSDNTATYINSGSTRTQLRVKTMTITYAE